MKNKLSDLNNHLYAQLERLNDEDTQGEVLESEIARSKAVQGLGSTIINNAKLALDAEKFKTEYSRASLPDVLEDKPKLQAIKHG